MPFNLRSFEDENRAKLGAVECVNHKLIEPFQVLYDRPGKAAPVYSLAISIHWYLIIHISSFAGEYVAQFKFTVLLMPNSTMKITGIPLDTELYKSQYSVTDPELQVCLNVIKIIAFACSKIFHLRSSTHEMIISATSVDVIKPESRQKEG